ncbi:solute carrier organic anion transporter family member 1B3-like [Orycteropus afer afer]|uniref:Solute carrier organic anion transporter family member n=1 Tax=Orycteropus afer afer TaxID=1230840 RepID=A0A8B7AG69_ORYAF|nr:solute carrier organic anion transporter family member 1B3-like [Orycteropus afer afer]
MFFMALSFSYVAKALGGVIMKSSITQIERRFDISSSFAGLIDGSFEIGVFFKLQILNNKWVNKLIQMIGTNELFLTKIGYSKDKDINPSSNSTSSLSTCLINKTLLFNRTSPEIVGNDCVKESGSYMWIYVLMGNMLRGIGETPIVPLGVAYIDDFAKEGHSSFYIGILNATAIIGLAIGFLLGSQITKLYVDVGYIDLSSIQITPKDSRWVGAWWLGFLVAGLFSIMSSIPFFFLPKSLNKPQEERKVSISSQASKTNKEMKLTGKLTKYEQKVTENVTGFCQSLKSILTNPLYVIFLFLMLLHISGYIGTSSFIFKYIEQQFGQSIAEANLWTGLISMPTISFGLFIGGYIIKKFKLSLVGIAKLSFSAFLLSFIFQLSHLLLLCETKSVAGLTLTYDGRKPLASHMNVPLSYCNSDCNCDESQWEPVCGKNGITYLSPCLAGCKSSGSSKKPEVFYNCSCVDITGFKNSSNSAHLGECPRGDRCTRNLRIYIAVQALGTFSAALGFTPSVMLIFKNVQPELKSLAMGFHSLTIRSLGTIRYYYYSMILSLKGSALILFVIFLRAMKKKYEGKDTKTSENGKKVVNEANLEGLNNNRHFVSSSGEDDETCT